jgi:hypothetical protein
LNIARWLPLIGLAQRSAGSLEPNELQGIAVALAGEQAEGILPLLTALKDSAPNEKVVGLLGSPAAAKLYAKLRADTEAENSIVFCKCPACGVAFETDLK